MREIYLARQQQLEHLQAERNRLSKSVRSAAEAAQIRPQVQAINEQIAALQQQLKAEQEQARAAELLVRNQPAPEVPVGRDEHDNQLLKEWGRIPTIEDAQPHEQLAGQLGLLDQELTVQLVGSRFSTYTGLGARLQRALVNLMLDQAAAAGYREMSPPALIRGEALTGTGQLPKFAEDLYQLSDDGLYLIPTAEVPLTALYAQRSQALGESELPLRFAAYTPCFRREAGAYGRDTRGLIRQHQFDKVELVHICRPADAASEHERLVSAAERILELLELPYRRMLLCTGDLGFAARKCYDLEVWFPAQGSYREISSCSDCGDFQARRLGLRFQPKDEKRKAYVHTLNGSGVAIGRAWAAILENYQQADGSVVIPTALRSYLGGLECIEPS